MSSSSDRGASEVFVRVVGRRWTSVPGQPPDARARAAMTDNARYLTRAPKGVFLYRSHEEANADRQRWLVEAMVARER